MIIIYMICKTMVAIVVVFRSDDDDNDITCILYEIYTYCVSHMSVWIVEMSIVGTLNHAIYLTKTSCIS